MTSLDDAGWEFPVCSDVQWWIVEVSRLVNEQRFGRKSPTVVLVVRGIFARSLLWRPFAEFRWRKCLRSRSIVSNRVETEPARRVASKDESLERRRITSSTAR